jgi:hypothetical protein
VLRDAIASISIPVVEVHLSDISMREGFRALSVMVDACIGQFKGRGVDSYKDALEALVKYLAAPVNTHASGSEKNEGGDLDMLETDEASKDFLAKESVSSLIPGFEALSESDSAEAASSKKRGTLAGN